MADIEFEGIDIVFLPNRLELLDEQVSPSGTGKADMCLAFWVVYFSPTLPT